MIQINIFVPGHHILFPHSRYSPTLPLYTPHPWSSVRMLIVTSTAPSSTLHTPSLHPTTMLPTDSCRHRPCQVSRLTPRQTLRRCPAVSSSSLWLASLRPDQLLRRRALRSRPVCTGGFHPWDVFVRWCFVCCFGVALLVTLFFILRYVMYRRFTTNGSLVFTSKKVEFPASLVKRDWIFYRYV